MPNTFIPIYVKYIVFKLILLITFLNEPELIFFSYSKNDFAYFYLIQIMIIIGFVYSEMFNTNNSIKH